MFKETTPNKLFENPVHLFSKQWMLVTAGKLQSFNLMTASWGGIGYVWNLPVTTIYIRPQRQTFEYIENNDYYTLCFFEREFKNILTYCGSHSGKDFDKIKETGLVPLETENGSIYYDQARLVLECKKIYYDDIRPEHFIDRLINRNYPRKDYHRIYIGKIVKCLIKDTDET